MLLLPVDRSDTASLVSCMLMDLAIDMACWCGGCMLFQSMVEPPPSLLFRPIFCEKEDESLFTVVVFLVSVTAL